MPLAASAFDRVDPLGTAGGDRRFRVIPQPRPSFEGFRLLLSQCRSFIPKMEKTVDPPQIITTPKKEIT
jgi:hypothetical protein